MSKLLKVTPRVVCALLKERLDAKDEPEYQLLFAVVCQAIYDMVYKPPNPDRFGDKERTLKQIMREEAIEKRELHNAREAREFIFTRRANSHYEYLGLDPDFVRSLCEKLGAEVVLDTIPDILLEEEFA